jgi:diacylglycerol kinase family enzyme
METLVILNPTAGGGVDPAAFRRHLRRTLEAELAVTGAPGEAGELASAAARAGCQCVVAAGGDGTVAEVASALYRAGGEAVLGLIPVGTTWRGLSGSLCERPKRPASWPPAGRGSWT